MASSNTQRTMAYLKNDLGLRCAIVEKWNSFVNRRQDLFGFIDIIALDPENEQIIGVQSFGADFQPHLRKIVNEKREDAILWLQTGNAIMLVGWRQLKRRNKDNSWSKKSYWTPREYMVTMKDFNPETLEKRTQISNKEGAE